MKRFFVILFTNGLYTAPKNTARIPLNVNQEFFSGRAEFDGNIPDGDYFAWAIWKFSG